MKVLVIRPGERPEAVDTDVSLPWLQEQVDGYIEVVRIDGGLMVVNEEGKLKGLTLNPLATTLYPGDHILGTVVVTGPEDGDGDFTAVDESLAQRLMGSPA